MIQIEIRNYLRHVNEMNLMSRLLKPVNMRIETIYPKDKVITILYSLFHTIKLDFMATEMYPNPKQVEASRAKTKVLVIMNVLMRIGEPKHEVIFHITQHIPATIWPNWRE